ncbi:helix-turn-helix transcriptional regulator [Thalassobius sp. I31.1]|uniref:helix-turn-helix transcriptional regulator n=1 Tax=Thalassobius sp. I31.1 TaxID=2109912 RepID=UPI000D19A3A2|nr:helix-turn-helix transcriptional regulator [Thalassobius sp. I31.1]
MRSSKVISRVRTYREAEPFETQQSLADDLGVSRQTIIAIESGRYSPSLDLALRIARHFHLSVEEVFALDDAPENDQ